jgi:NitT/TauT family transport system substrate-binding protein
MAEVACGRIRHAPTPSTQTRVLLHRRSFLVAGLAGALSLPSRSALAFEKDRIALGVGGKSVLYYLPLTVAERLGYFRDEGLTVDTADLAGGAKVLQALLGGSTNVGVSSYDTTIRMQAKGQDVRAVIELGRFPGIALAVKKDKVAAIRTFADLTSLKIGVSGPGSLTHIVVQYLVAKAGGDPKRVIAIGVGTGASAVAGIEQGELDAMCNAEPIISKLEADGAVTVIADMRTEAGTRAVFGTPNPAAAVYFKQDYLARNHDVVQALVNAFYRSLRWLAQASPKAVVDLVPSSYHLGDKELYARAVAASLESYSRTGIVPEDGRESALKLLTLADPQIASAKIDLAATFDDRFVREAQRRYGA